MTSLSNDQRRMFRDQFRRARGIAFRDAEGFVEIIHVLESMGALMLGYIHSLGRYEDYLETTAALSPLAVDIPSLFPGHHIPSSRLLSLVISARNDFAHQGACARQMTSHASELSLIMEDALMNDSHKACDFMVRNPVSVEAWEPVSHARKQMLVNGYSFLPIDTKESGGRWKLVSDHQLSRFLRHDSEVTGGWRKRLSTTLDDAIKKQWLFLENAPCCEPETSIGLIVEKLENLPFLVVDPATPDHLLGIVTAYDLL